MCHCRSSCSSRFAWKSLPRVYILSSMATTLWLITERCLPWEVSECRTLNSCKVVKLWRAGNKLLWAAFLCIFTTPSSTVTIVLFFVQLCSPLKPAITDSVPARHDLKKFGHILLSCALRTLVYGSFFAIISFLECHVCTSPFFLIWVKELQKLD